MATGARFRSGIIQGHVLEKARRERDRYAEVSHTPRDVVPIENPHLTFHPPNYFHLTDGRNEVWAGIADVPITLAQDGRLQSLRFTSRPASDLREPGPIRGDAPASFFSVFVDSFDRSVTLGIDIVQLGARPIEPTALRNDHLDWGAFTFHVFARHVPSQVPTLAWYHQH